MFNYRSIRRNFASRLNGLLISRFGAKIVPARSRSVRYRKTDTQDGLTIMEVSRADQVALIALRNGSSDWMTFDQIFVDEDYDLQRLARSNGIRTTYETILRSGRAPLILDLGANIGLSAIYFSLMWPEASVLAVEPDPENVIQLRRNIATISSIDALEAAVANENRRLRIADPAAPKNAVRVVGCESGAGTEVAVITVSELLEQQEPNACVPFIVKIDIEGGENGLFKSNVGWIDRIPVLIVELHDWLFPGERTSRSFLQAIASRDRDFVYLDENIFSISNRLVPLSPGR